MRAAIEERKGKMKRSPYVIGGTGTLYRKKSGVTYGIYAAE